MTTQEEQLIKTFQSEHQTLSTLVAMLKEEQQLILQRQTEPLLNILIKIEDHLVQTRAIQQERDQLLRQILKITELSEPATLMAKIKLLPSHLLDKTLRLGIEIETEVKVVHEITYQNHVLLSRSVYFLEEVLAPLLASQKEMTTYGKNGVVQKGKVQNSYQAVA
jgi:flagellar biosynthesis/type III secretory pathway chaperone